MHVPAHFEEKRTEVLHDLISGNPFGILVTHCADGLDANHLPFGLDREGGPLGVLHAHVARANSIWRNVTDGDDVLVVFQAGDAYVSPNWYPSKQEFHKQVPTWNYVVAHVHGRIAVHDDARIVRSIVARLTKIQEATQPEPWKMSDSPREFIDAMVKAVVGIEVHITRLIGKSKLSQNKEPRDIRGAGHALKAQGNHVIGDSMLTIPAAKE
jgi:transcriptional regulator